MQPLTLLVFIWLAGLAGGCADNRTEACITRMWRVSNRCQGALRAGCAARAARRARAFPAVASPSLLVRPDTRVRQRRPAASARLVVCAANGRLPFRRERERWPARVAAQ